MKPNQIAENSAMTLNSVPNGQNGYLDKQDLLGKSEHSLCKYISGFKISSLSL